MDSTLLTYSEKNLFPELVVEVKPSAPTVSPVTWSVTLVGFWLPGRVITITAGKRNILTLKKMHLFIVYPFILLSKLKFVKHKK
jgi:hypothetical protein